LQKPSNSSVNSKLELIRLFGLSLGDVINLNRLAMQAADMSIQANADVRIGASVMTINGNMY
jgi:cytidine deaminase